jgi:hypothetical protein
LGTSDTADTADTADIRDMELAWKAAVGEV